MKKCEHCGTFCQDADVVCGVCGSSVANTPLLKGTIEEEIVRDREEAERENILLKQTFAKESRRILLRKLVISIPTIAIGSATLVYATALGVSHELVYTGDFVFLADLLAFAAGFALIIFGLNLGIKGVTTGVSYRERGRSADATPSYMFNTISNQTMTSTYKGQFLPKPHPDENQKSD